MRVLAAGRLVTLRAYSPAHIDPLYAAVCESIAEVGRYETWCRPGYSREDAAAYVNWWRDAWARDTAYYFAVEHRDTGEFLGSCGLSDILRDHKRGGVGYWIRSGYTGRGYATDAVRTILRLGFEDLGLERMELEIAVDNAASRRVAEKVGCIYEGILRRRLILPAGPTDTAIYAWLHGECPAP
jgi:RimJ/RimL family protein N-acetyltransferase